MDRFEHALDRFVGLGRSAVWLLPGVLVTYFALIRNSAEPEGVAVAVLFMLLVLAVAAVGTDRPLHGWGLRLLPAALPLAFLVAWTLASAGWSGSGARAAIEADRTLLYATITITFAVFGYTDRRARALLIGLFAAIAIACALGVASRLLPGLVSADPGPTPERLCYPVTYWNAMGLLAGFGVILSLHLSASLAESRLTRCLAAAAAPMLASALLLTLSRGAIWATVLGLAVYILVARPRGLPAAAVAIVPATGLALLGLDHGDVLGATPEAIAAMDLAGQPAWLLGFAMAAAGLLRALGLPLDSRLGAIRLETGTRRALLGTGFACLAVGIALSVVIAQSLGIGDQAYDRFVAGVGISAESRDARLTNLSNNNRISKWRVALDEYREDRLHGAGAGTYQLAWLEHRPSDGRVLDAHSLYLETLGELGWPGMLALGVALLALLGGLALRSRGPGRAAPAALLACGVTWAAVAAADWDWEMPVVTVGLFAAGGLALARDAGAPARRGGRRGLALRLAVAAGCLVLAVLPLRIALSEISLQRSTEALYVDDCAQVQASARSALSALDGQWRAWQLIAYCAIREERWEDAAAALREASERDPRNWAPYYGLAMVQAAARQDPTAALAAARARNPQFDTLSLAPGETRRQLVARLRGAARKASLPLS